MPTEVKKKDNSLLYLVSTISFIIMGIILTGIINQSKSNDIRSRASATNGITATAIVSEVKYGENTVIVDQLTFTSSPQKNMGSWIVTTPTTAKIDALTTGMKVQIIIDPPTLQITEHTLTAKEIKKK